MELRIGVAGWGLALLGSLGLLGCEDEVIKATCTPSGTENGLEQCEEGYRHRVNVSTCQSDVPRAGQTCDDGGSGNCSSDSDCTERPHGVCSMGQICGCSYGCTTDADCDDGFACVCGELTGSCVQASCGTDGDCAEGMLCALSSAGSAGCSHRVLACTHPDDQCSVDADCADSGECLVGADGVRRCEPFSCAVGRPFLVASAPVVAPSAERADWLRDLQPRLPIAADTRAALAAHWTQTALMEHASVAAFARFALQLMALGAPAELIEQSTRAQADELRHARLCFALASAYADRPVGPGALEVKGALDDVSPEAILRTAFREGCVGETAAALEALEAAERATDPVLARALKQVGADESRHAELAWHFVRWMARTQGAWVAAALREELASVVVPESGGAGLEEHGVLDGERKRLIRERALAEVIAPATERLLALARETRTASTERRRMSEPPAS